MNEEPKVEELNPLSDTYNDPTTQQEIKPVPTIDVVEPVEVVSPVPTIDNVEPVVPVVENVQPVETINPVLTEQVETVVEQPKSDVEVLDIDLNREKPTVVTEQVIDKVTEKKQASKSSLVLVVVVLLIVALAVIFIPQLSSLFK